MSEHRRTGALYLPIALAWAAIAVLLHVLINARYGYARDELYFIECAKHLTWGYVDQPPLAVLVAWLAFPFHFALWAVRLPLALLSGVMVVAGCAVAAQLGAGRFAQMLTGLLMALAPPYLAQGYILSTEFLSPLAWTGVVYFSLRLVKTGNARYYLSLALVITIAMYAKYTMAALVVAMLLGLLIAGHAKLLRSKYLVIGVALAVLLFAPNILWQAHHNWPILEVMHGDKANRHPVHGISVESADMLTNAVVFLLMQILLVNPLLAGIWIWGLLALAFQRAFSAYRYIAVTYGLLVVLMILLTARVYYLDGFYPVLFAAGAVSMEILLSFKPRALKAAVLLLVLLLDLPLMPMTIPLLSLPVYERYEGLLGLSRIGSPDGKPHLVNPAYADQLGWDDMARTVAIAYRSLPAAQRAKTPIFADRYAYAAALDFFGPKYGLPRVISPNNSYYLWGTRGYSGNSMIAVGATDYPLLLRSFDNVRQIAVYRNEKRWILEGPLPVYLCTRPRATLAQMWPSFKYYGL
ncbi:MAG: hypothetical protein DLM50_01525 [Candidatus Meridianibacter frigidus]|nr:MAG: hypothetical protein DLM50_01525 [Candidatus Eremiobacteraeota bacterium]